MILRRSAVLLAAVAAGCDSSNDPAALPDVMLSGRAEGPNTVSLAWTPPVDARSVVLRDGSPISIASAATTWRDVSVLSDRTYDYAVEARDAEGRVVARGATRISTPPIRGWTRADVFASGGTGAVSTAVGVDGVLHVLFHDAHAGALRYGRDDGRGMVFEEVARGARTGVVAALALDVTGAPHAAFGSDGRVAHAERTATATWQVATLESGLEPAAVAIAVDAVDSVHVVWRPGSTQTGLRLSTRAAGTWTHGWIPALGPTGGSVGLAVVDGTDLHILYFAGPPGRLGAYISRREAGAWTTERVVAVDRAVGGIAAEPSGVLHLGLLSATEALHVEGATGAWRIAALPGLVTESREVRIAVSPFGDVHMTVYGFGSYDLWHASRVDGSWSSSFVDADGDVGESAAIAVARRAAVRIFYNDATNGTLRLATGR